jgi:hypothetical protein
LETDEMIFPFILPSTRTDILTDTSLQVTNNLATNTCLSPSLSVISISLLNIARDFTMNMDTIVVPDDHKGRKEIYTYQAPWTVYAMSWSRRGEGRNKFRMAIGSFKEEYSNEIKLIQLVPRDVSYSRRVEGKLALSELLVM